MSNDQLVALEAKLKIIQAFAVREHEHYRSNSDLYYQGRGDMAEDLLHLLADMNFAIQA